MRTLVAAAMLVAAVLTPALVARQGKPVFPFPYETLRLDNGLRAYLIKAGAPGQIAYVTVVRTGSRDEVEPGKSGFAHFFEHMMFAGTAKYPDFDGETTKMGAFRNASTSNDLTIYYMVANSEYLEKIADIESDRFMNLRYTEASFRTEAGAILGEHQQGANEPARFLNEKLRETAFDKHTYRHTTIGFEADVRAMPTGYEYSLGFYQRFYRPENSVLIIAGDFDMAKTKALITKYYGGWKPGYQAPAVTPEPPQTAPRERTVTYPGRTLPVLSINYKAPAFDPTSRVGVALEVLGQAAFGPNSALYRKLVLDERRVQSLGASFDLPRDPYLVTVQTMVSNPSDVAAVQSEVMTTIRSLHDTLITPKQLADARSNIKYGYLMSMEAAMDVAFGAADMIVNTGRLEPIEDYFRTLDAVTPEDVRQAARTYLVENGRTTITMVQGN